ncbi:MAG TPA: hypothetical protein VK638_08380, partial [Edaphobacter sp.]|nr:hypothetical protein [Edaphobacter sp.]
SPRNDKARRFLNDFLQHVNSGRSAATGATVPMDFISLHVKGQSTITNGQVQMGIDRELKDADKGFEAIASYPRFHNLPIILSEADPEGCEHAQAK